MKRYNSEQDWLDTRPACWGCGYPIRSRSRFVVNGMDFCHDCEDAARDRVWAKIKFDYLEDIPDD